MANDRDATPRGASGSDSARREAPRPGAAFREMSGSDTTRPEWLKGAAGLLIAAGPARGALAQAEYKSFRAAGMTFRWTHLNGRLYGDLRAPTRGWLAVGFNDREELPGTRFLIGAFENGLVRAEVHRAGADGTHARIGEGVPSAWVPGGEGWTDEVQTQLTFAAPHDASEFAPLTLTPGARLYAMLAWSEAPEFDHHSHEREHGWVTL